MTAWGNFVGKQLELYEVTKMLQKQGIRMVCINGQVGSGKTRMVTELSRYLAIRKTFKDGVYYIDFLKAKTLKDMN